jgi:spore maturation protein CgeB
VKIVVFGLTISSSWGNGHATLWRGLCSALSRRGHRVTFFERDTQYYAAARDLTKLPGRSELIIYGDWLEIARRASRELMDCDAAIVTSYCPDAITASNLVRESGAGLRVFYDLDSPITLAKLAQGETVEWVGSDGYRGFDLVLSYAGGKTLERLKSVLGAERVEPLYGSVDPDVHRPATPLESYRAALSYMGTHSPDRGEALRELFVEPARRLPDRRFVIGGSKYDGSFPWQPNIFYLSHLAPAQHGAFYCSSDLTLNVTRRAMVESGHCPSGRLFEAAACGAAILSDSWDGLDLFYAPGSEILIAHRTADAMDALHLDVAELARVGLRARERTLDCHTSEHRVSQLEAILDSAYCKSAVKVTSCGE